MPSMEVTHRMIEAFRAAMLNGGVSAGADALGIPQPSMSRLIADLQRVVGFPLFQKSGRSVKPTDEALVLMTKVQQSFIGLEEITGFSEQLRKQRMGRFSICTIPSIGHWFRSLASSAMRSPPSRRSMPRGWPCMGTAPTM